MSANASPTAAVAPTARREQAAASPAVAQAGELASMANAIRALAMDAVEQAKSGHPGLPMGAADVATVLFTRFLKFDPADPAWPDRDRFVLSAGHGSMLIYALLYLTGYPAMTIEQIKRFRQLGSITAGHPEYGHTPGVETTTGPLGQGLANAVGMAIAERHLAAEFGADVVDHKTYVLASDGDLMEGISQEAIALAGHLKLNRLIVLFDDNGISIDGALSLTDSVDQVKRFEAAGWTASRIDGHDPAAIAAALEKAQSVRQAGDDRLQDHHRLRRADQSRQVVGARLAARRRRDQGRAREARLDRTRRSKFPPTFCPPGARPASARRARMPTGASGSPRSTPAKRAEFERRMKGDLPKPAFRRRRARGEAVARRHAEGNRHPHGVRIRAREPDPGAAGNGRRLGRPHRLQQHAHQIDEGDERGRLFRPLHPLRRARARHGRRHERHGAARRHHPLFRHLPGVLRLLPPGDPARRADGQARHPRHDARLHRAGRGRPDPSAGRASGRAARDSQSARVPPLRRGGDRRMLAARARSEKPPERAGADTAEPAAAQPEFPRHATAAPPAPTRSRRPTARRGFDLRHRLGSRDRGRGEKAARPRAAFPRAWCRCPASSCCWRRRRRRAAR